MAAESDTANCPFTTFFSDGYDALGPGWDLEIRQAESGFLLWSSGFCLDDGGWLLRATLAELLQSGRPVAADAGHYLAMAPSKIIEEGRAAGLRRGEIHRLLLAHPRIWEFQRNNLRAYRRQGGAAGG
jgi:hypothetical protein